MRTTTIALFVLFVFSAVAFSATPSKQLIAAMIMEESSGDDNAIGDRELKDKAYGPLQIRQPVCTDVNNRYGTNYRSEDCLGNRELSVSICVAYISMYATEKRLGRKPTDEDMARIWNGGPNGFKKKSTLGYWPRVKEHWPSS